MNSGQGGKEFKTEVLLVGKLHHRNLVRLLGFCNEGEERLLIYELMPNLSLDRFLSDANLRSTLQWQERYKIITGISRGLQYLHEDSQLKDCTPGPKTKQHTAGQGDEPQNSRFWHG